MRTFFIIPLLLLCSQLTAQFPVVLENISGGGLYVRTDPDYGASSITLIAWHNMAVALDFELDEGAETFDTYYWYEIDLPDPDGPETGWTNAGFDFVNSQGEMLYYSPKCTNDFVEVTWPALNVRTGPGVGYSQITISGDPAQLWDGQQYACTGESELVGTAMWYEIYLPNYCSDTKGWCSAGTGDIYLDLHTSGGGDCDEPNTPTSFDATAISSTSIQLDWNSPAGGAEGYVIYECGEENGIAFTTSTLYDVTDLDPLPWVINELEPDTYYDFEINAYNIFGISSTTSCQGATTDDDGPTCNIPSGLFESSVTENSAILNWNDEADATSFNIRYRAVGALTWSTSVVFVNTKTLSVLVDNTTYEWQVESNCGGELSGYSTSQYFTTLEVEATITVNNLLCDIPGWQRDNEPIGFSGSINATTDPPGQSWRLKVYKNDGASPVWTSSPTTTSTILFSSASFGIWNEGDNYKYVAERVADLTNDEAVEHTVIIAEKWDYENVFLENKLYLDGDNDIELKIPLPYGGDNPADYVLINRSLDNGSVCFTISPFNLYPDGIKGDLTPTNKFTISNDGYCHINITNSNIDTVLPGDFNVSVFSNLSPWPIETFKFDLTKYGKMLSNNTDENIIVMVGGLSSTIEKEVDEIPFSEEITSENSYSVTSYLSDKCDNHDFNIWYVATGNANLVERNGYDIGKSLELINAAIGAGELNEIDIICHSKGGLDVRAYLQGVNKSFDGDLEINYEGGPLDNKIQKVLFLGVPHNGAPTAEITTSIYELGIEFVIPDIYEIILDLFYTDNLFPGVEDLEGPDFWGTNIVEILNSSYLPLDIEYGNLTGYKTEIGGIFGGGANYFNSSTDGVVPLESSNSLSINFPLNRIKQMYQYAEFPLWPISKMSHFDTHKNFYLSESDANLNMLDCIYPFEYLYNLEKIKDFIDQYPPYTLSYPFYSCDAPELGWISFEIPGSIVTNASILLKRTGSESYFQLGQTNEAGTFSASLIPMINIGDSIQIQAVGYYPINFAVDSIYLISNKVITPILKSTVPTSYLNNVGIQTTNRLFSTNDAILEVAGNNVLNLLINTPFNQDSIFSPIEVIANKFNITLDSGRNTIIVKFIGAVDSINVVKDLFYYPETLFDSLSYNINFLAAESDLPYKVFIDDIFIREINNIEESIPYFNGIHYMKINKYGYNDTVLIVNSDTLINIGEYLNSYSLSNEYNNRIYDFIEGPQIQSWKNVTLLDTTRSTVISLRQFDLDPGYYGLEYLSRCFEITHINEELSTIRFAAALDQSMNLDLDSILLMQIYDDSIFNKLQLDSIGLIAGYDSIVQKLNYNEINFNGGSALKESLVIVKKQPPIPLPEILDLNINDSIVLPISTFFADPDSIPNDLSIAISGLSVGLNASIFGDSILIYPDECWSGQGYITLDGTHDWLSRTVTDTINVINTEAPIIYYEPSLILCAGETITLSTDFTEEIFWSNGETTTSIIVDEPGNYFVGHYGECGLATSDTLVVILNNSPESEFEFSLDNLTTTFTNLSTDGETYLWDFGDGITSSEINALHTYSEAGSYYVTLTATNTCGISMFSDSVVIAYPNLIGSIEFSPSMIQYGDSLYVTVSITNDGESTAKYIDADGELEAFVNRIKISQDSCSFVTASLLGVFYTDSIQPGETITFSDAYYIDDTYAIDTFFILFIANAAEKVTEATFVDNQICSLPDTLFIVDSTCAYNLPVTEAFFSNIVSSGSFILNTLYDCNWAISSYAPWITITSDLSGSGTTEITFEIEENSACATRTGNIEISGQIFEVIQEGTESSYTLSSYSVSFLPSGGDGSLVVNATSDCAYYADCISTWVHFESGPYNSSTEFEFTVDPNLGGPRSTIVNIADTSFTIIQGPVGIIQIPGGEIKIYPNPVDGLVTIECSSLFDFSEIFISNSLGQRIENIKPENLASCKYSYDLSNIANGNYWVNFIIEEEIYSYQIVVNH